MRRKKILAAIMSVFMALSLLPAAVSAAAVTALGGKLAVSGIAAEGSELSAEFKDVTPAGLAEDSVTYEWFRQTTEDEEAEKAGEQPELKSLGKEKKYTVTADDIGSKIVLTVTGSADKGFEGSLKATTATVVSKEEAAAAADNPEYAGDSSEAAEESSESEAADNTGDSADQAVTEEETTSDETAGTESADGIPAASDDSAAGTESMDGIPAATDDSGTENGSTDTSAETQDASAGGEYTEQSTESTETEYQEDTSSGTSDQAGTESVDGIPAATEDGTMETTETADTGSGENAESEENGESGENSDSAGETAAAAFTLSVNDSDETGIMNFGTLTADNSGDTEKYVTITNTGTSELYFDTTSPKNFWVKDVTDPLQAGESVTLAVGVRPETAAAAGEYKETITYSAWDADRQTNVTGSFDANVIIEKTEEPAAASSVTANAATVDFGTVTEGYTAPEAKTITLTNGGTGAAQLSVSESDAQSRDFFDAVLSDAAVPGAGGEAANTATLTITPKTNLPAQDGEGTLYQETITITDSSANAAVPSIEITVSMKVEPKQQEVHKLTISSLAMDFGSAQKGYGQVEAQQVTVYNEGNVAETLTQPAGTNFEVSAVDASALTVAAGGSVSFTVRPKTGLDVNTYSETINIGSASASTGFTAAFQVTKATVSVTKIQNPANITGLSNGTAKDVKSLKLPSTVVIETTGGNMKASVSWNLKNCSYSTSSTETQTFKVNGTVTLPDGVDNNNKLSLTATVQVSVGAYSPRTVSADNNKITGITYNGTYTTQSRITFTAVGAGMDNTSPRKGDTRYIPASWKALTETTFNDSSYTGNFGISETGNYTLTVTFRQQQYDGAKWAETGKTDTKQVPFVITKATATVTNPGLDITPAANKRNAVKTGDNTPIAPFVIILVAAAAAIGGVVVYRRKRK